MEFIAVLIALAWWQIVFVLFIGVLFCVAWSKESALGTFFALLAGIVTLHFFGVQTITLEDIIKQLIYLVGFLIIGVLWARFKWGEYVQEKIIKYTELKYHKAQIISLIKQNRDNDEIAFWIVAWPLSLLGFLVGDLFYKLLAKISNWFDYVTVKSVNKHFDNLEKSKENSK